MSPSASHGPSLDISPLEAPPLRIPPSTSTVRLQAIDTTTNLHCDASAFIRPIVPGHEKLNLPTMCFLLENKSQSKFILFDCGSRKDFWNGPPKTKMMIAGHTEGVKIEKGVDEVLVDSGFDLANLGEFLLFYAPLTFSFGYCSGRINVDERMTKMQLCGAIGIGITRAMRRNSTPVRRLLSAQASRKMGLGLGIPRTLKVSSSRVTSRKFVICCGERKYTMKLNDRHSGRNLREISFSDFKIGSFRAHDFFDDGSFYILDTPGVEHFLFPLS
jgi:hypothetical protein